MTASASIEYTRQESYSETPGTLIRSPAAEAACLLLADDVAMIEKVPPFKQANDESRRARSGVLSR